MRHGLLRGGTTWSVSSLTLSRRDQANERFAKAAERAIAQARAARGFCHCEEVLRSLAARCVPGRRFAAAGQV